MMALAGLLGLAGGTLTARLGDVLPSLLGRDIPRRGWEYGTASRRWQARSAWLPSARGQATLDELQEQLIGAPEMPADAGQLEGDIALLQEQAAELDNLWGALAARHVDWPEVLPTITRYDAELIQLTGMTQSENRILISGQGRHEAATLAYADKLEVSGQFARVSMQSMSVVGPADSATETDQEDAAADDAPEWTSAEGAVTFTILVEMETTLP